MTSYQDITRTTSAQLASLRADIPDTMAIQRLAAHGCFVSQQTFNRWKRGLVRPDEDKWPALHRTFGVPPHLWVTQPAREAVVRSAIAEAGQ